MSENKRNTVEFLKWLEGEKKKLDRQINEALMPGSILTAGQEATQNCLNFSKTLNLHIDGPPYRRPSISPQD